MVKASRMRTELNGISAGISASTAKSFQAGKMGLDKEIKDAHLKASEMWMDKPFANFIRRYHKVLSEAYIDFILEPSYETLQDLGFAIQDCKITSTKVRELMAHINLIEDMRTIWLS